MIVYLDLFILATIVVNYAFIKTIALIYKEKLKPIRVTFALILSLVMLFLFLLPYKIYFVIRYFMGIIIALTAFDSSDVKKLIIKTTIFYLLNLSFIGCLIVLNVRSVSMMFVTMIYIIFLYLIQSYQQENKVIKEIRIGNLNLKGFYDTGNITSYNNIPIVFINQKYFSYEFKELDNIYINTVEGPHLINIYIGPKLIINKIEKEVYYSFSKHIKYDVVLNKEIGG